MTMSQYFQGRGEEYNRLVYLNDGRAVSDICSGIRKHLLMLCELEQGKYLDVGNEFVWFDVCMKELTGLGIFQYLFDRETGYGLIKEGKWEILVLKTESLNANTEEQKAEMKARYRLE